MLQAAKYAGAFVLMGPIAVLGPVRSDVSILSIVWVGWQGGEPYLRLGLVSEVGEN